MKRFWMNWYVIVVMFISFFLLFESRECVYASETELVTSGTCGESTTWDFDLETRTLYLDGSGSVEYVKWGNFAGEIETIVIGKDVSAINLQNIWKYGSGSYSNFTNIEVNESNSVFCAKEGILFNKNGSVLLWFPQGREGSYVVPNDVTRIEEYGFYKCREITSVTIPSSVSTIGTGAFDGCVELSTVNFSEGLKVIESRAFSNCIRLQEIIIPMSTTNIGQRAFGKCTASEYGITGLESVKILGSDTILEGTDSVDSGVFYGCSGLKRVETASDIGYSAFVDCISLKDVILNEGVKKIDENAFVGCTSLTVIEIPKSATEIAGSAFIRCDQLKEFIVNSENTSFSVEDGVLFDKNKTKIIRYPNGKNGIRYEVPKNVMNIDECAFVSCQLQEINLHSKLENIGCFSSCKSLRSFVIPDGVTDASEMLENCSALEYIVVPRSVKEIGSHKANTFMLAGVSDALVIYGYSNTVLSDFNNFICLDDGISVKLNTNDGSDSSVSQITVYPAYTYGNMPIPQRDGYIFKGWYTKEDGGKKVESDTLVEQVQEHTLYAQWEREIISIENATVSFQNSFVYDGSEKKPIVTVILGGKTLTQGTDYTVAYNDCVEAGSATIIITGIGNYSGSLTKSYTILRNSLLVNGKVTLSATSYDYDGKAKKPSVTVTLGDKTLGKDDYIVTYKNNKNIGKATVTITGKGNYTGTIKQTFTIKLDKGDVFTSGKYKYKVTGSSTVAFNGISSTNITKVSIPKTVKHGGKTFKVTSIVDKALKGKTKVTQITIGANVTKIGSSAFAGCIKLSKVTMGTNVTSIGSSAFKGCTKLTKVSMGKKVKTVGVSAFENCKKLSTVTIGSAVTTIDDKAFKNCTALKSITIPSKVTKIDKQAFYGCKNLKTITIKSKKLKTVGKEAFKKINSKATIKVPKSMLKFYKRLLKGKGQGSKVKTVSM